MDLIGWQLAKVDLLLKDLPLIMEKYIYGCYYLEDWRPDSICDMNKLLTDVDYIWMVTMKYGHAVLE